MSEQDSMIKMTTESVIAVLKTDFQISEHEAENLMRFIRVNLKNLTQAIREAGKRRQWNYLYTLNQKLEAAAFNLHWQGLQKLCSFMRDAIDEKNETHLDSLIGKLPSIVSRIYHLSDDSDTSPLQN